MPEQEEEDMLSEVARKAFRSRYGDLFGIWVWSRIADAVSARLVGNGAVLANGKATQIQIAEEIELNQANVNRGLNQGSLTPEVLSVCVSCLGVTVGENSRNDDDHWSKRRGKKGQEGALMAALLFATEAVARKKNIKSPTATAFYRFYCDVVNRTKRDQLEEWEGLFLEIVYRATEKWHSLKLLDGP